MNWAPWRPFRNEWNRAYIPSRGLMYSFVVHEAALFLCFIYFSPARPKPELRTTAQEIQAAQLVYMPPIGSGGTTASEEGKSGAGKEGRESAKASDSPGVVFRGPQFIKSNPRNPDNHLQTVLQPALITPPKLHFNMQLPNLVRMAPTPPAPAVIPKPVEPFQVAKGAEPVPKPDPQLVATRLTSEREPLLALPLQHSVPAPAPKPIEVKQAAPAPVAPVLTADAQKSDQSIAVLNAIQIQAKLTVVPPGEKLGAFEVRPDGTATPSTASNAGPPARSSSAPSGTGSASAAGKGTGNSTPGDRKSLAGAGSGNGGKNGGERGSAASGEGAGGGSKGGGVGVKSASKGNGSSGTVAGKGTGGYGTPGGGGAGSGNGSAGGGTGSNPFSGLEIIGASGSGSNAGTPSLPSTAISDLPPQVYGFSLISSGGSGGGLKDFGVFHNEVVYTVYIDASTILTGARSIVLQYSDYAPPRTAEINLDGPATPQAMLEPPSPKRMNAAPAAAQPTYALMTVVTGLISPEGKFEGGRVLQASSDERGKQWLAALGTWLFHPGTKGKTPVPIKVVLGIPEN